MDTVIPKAILFKWTRVLRDMVDTILYNHRIPLPAPSVLLEESLSRHGSWDPLSRTIRINLRLMLDGPFAEVVETLKHEMAHMITDELFSDTDPTPHGEGFRKACRMLGLSGRSRASHPGSVSDSDATPEQKITRKIQKLLALSGSMNRHEAEAAMRKANSLLTAYNLSLDAGVEDWERDYAFLYLGKPKSRFSTATLMILNLLSDFYFVEYILVPHYEAKTDKRGTVIELLGRHENLQMAGYVYEFLIRQCQALWEAYKSENRLQGTALKRSYQAGLLQGFRRLLQSHRDQTGKALVWVGSPSLQTFMRTRHPRVQRTRGATTPLYRNAFSTGQKDGGRITLHRPIHHSGTVDRPALTRVLRKN